MVGKAVKLSISLSAWQCLLERGGIVRDDTQRDRTVCVTRKTLK